MKWVIVVFLVIALAPTAAKAVLPSERQARRARVWTLPRIAAVAVLFALAAFVLLPLLLDR